MTTDNEALAHLLAAEVDTLHHFKWLPIIIQGTGEVRWRDPSNLEVVSQSHAIARVKMRVARAALPTLDEVRS